VVQLLQIVGDGQARPVKQVGRRDPHRERQPGAESDEFRHLRRLGVTPGVAHDGLQQSRAVLVRKWFEDETASAVACDQPGQAGPAGDDDVAARLAGKQGSHLVDVVCVVQHD
jgi:hypothetical protein